MNNSPRMKLLTLCIGAALAQMASLSALADSGVGVDTLIGNAANPGYTAGVPVVADPDSPPIQRTPSGQMYSYPPAKDDVAKGQLAGEVEFGYMYNSDNKAYAKRKEYSDPAKGLFVDHFKLSLESDAARYFTINGGNPGRRDQFYDLTVGKYNDWKLKGFYNETPHVFSTTFKPVYQNNGSNWLTLNGRGSAAGSPAVSSQALLDAALAMPNTEVGLVRKKGGLRGDITLDDNWKGYASIAQEKRKGERPFGLYQNAVGTSVFANSAATPIEGVEPIDYVTNDILAGLNYSNKVTSFNLRASASLFSNNIHTLWVENPFLQQNSAPTTLAVSNVNTGMSASAFSLAPDNKAYNLKGEFSHKMPEFYRANFTASAALGTSRQDDKIRTPLDPAYTGSMTGTAGNVATAAQGSVPFSANNWNGVNGNPLSRATSGQRIDTQMLNFGLSLNPVDALNVKGSYRHYATKNKSGTYYAYNPLTGQWGAGPEYGNTMAVTVAPLASGAAGCQAAPGYPAPSSAVCSANNAAGLNAIFGNQRQTASLPRDFKQDNIVLAGTYDLDQHSIEAALERENYTHTFRERDKTWENKIKLGYVNRSLGATTLRTSIEKDTKRGSFYDPLYTDVRGFVQYFETYGQHYSRDALKALITQASTAGVGGTGNIPTLAMITALMGQTAAYNSGGWMKADQADRNQNILNARVNYMASEDMDVGANVQLKRATYPANSRGVQRDNLNSYNFDMNYSPSIDTQFSAYYSFQTADQDQIENYGNLPVGVASLNAYAATQCTGSATGTLSAANLDCWVNNLRVPSSDVFVHSKTNNNILGLGASHNYGTVRLGVNYTYAMSMTEISQIFGTTALTATQGTTNTTYGGLPKMRTRQHTLDFNVVVPINTKLTSRVFYRYDLFAVSDWHYDYLATAPSRAYIPGNMGYQGYHLNSLGVLLDYKL